MPLRGNNQQPDSAAGKKAETVFTEIQKKYARASTEVITFRIPYGEKERLRAVFSRKGFTLSEALKIALYRFAEEVESGKIDLLITRKDIK